MTTDILIQILIFFLLAFVIIFVRYLALAGAYHYLFYRLLRRVIKHRVLDDGPLPEKQIRKEIYWSTLSAIIFAGFGVGMYFLWWAGWTRIYDAVDTYPLWYLFLSIPLVLFMQDTYYYWLHRWMHLPRIYRYLHKIHHNSIHTSAFTSFSFHPAETILQAILLPVLIMILPLHFYVILGVLTLMTFSAIINHAGVDVSLTGKWGQWLSKWFIGAAHHDHHHRKFKVNFGLYFTFWDRWMKTEESLH